MGNKSVVSEDFLNEFMELRDLKQLNALLVRQIETREVPRSVRTVTLALTLTLMVV